MLVKLKSVPIVKEMGHDISVIVVLSPHRLLRQVKQGQVDDVSPAHVHPLEALGAGVAEGADEQPGEVSGDDGHVVGPGGETPLVEPLATSDTADHLTVPGAPAPAVTVNILQKKNIIMSHELTKPNIEFDNFWGLKAEGRH